MVCSGNDNHESEIYSLYEICREDNERVNNTAAYDKQYLEVDTVRIPI